MRVGVLGVLGVDSLEYDVVVSMILAGRIIIWCVILAGIESDVTKLTASTFE